MADRAPERLRIEVYRNLAEGTRVLPAVMTQQQIEEFSTLWSFRQRYPAKLSRRKREAALDAISEPIRPVKAFLPIRLFWILEGGGNAFDVAAETGHRITEHGHDMNPKLRLRGIAFGKADHASLVVVGAKAEDPDVFQRPGQLQSVLVNANSVLAAQRISLRLPTIAQM